jgi:hypothetical protein
MVAELVAETQRSADETRDPVDQWVGFILDADALAASIDDHMGRPHVAFTDEELMAASRLATAFNVVPRAGIDRIAFRRAAGLSDEEAE